VNAVIEIDEVRKIVHASPPNRFTGSPTLADRFQIGRVGPDLIVTVHAGSGRRDPGERSFLDSRVAISAVDAVLAYVVFVAELNGLLARKKRLSVVRGSVELQQQPENYRDEEDRAKDTELGYVVSASTKDLAHGLPSSEAESEKQSASRGSGRSVGCHPGIALKGSKSLMRGNSV